MRFPRMVTARQKLVRDPLRDPAGALEDGLERAGFDRLFAKGKRAAVAVGSRKIDWLVLMLAWLMERLVDAGCDPFIIPAMGSHGGATAEGQAGVLRGLGITKDTAGAPVVSSMDTVPLGVTQGGAEVFASRAAMEADAIVVVNRVAPHTGYSGPLQSGLCKMLAVGLGKRDGAAALHRHGFGASHLIGEAADLVLEKVPVVMGIAVVEDGGKRLSRVEVLRREEIREREPELLQVALSMYPNLPVSEADVLVVDEMGKDISGIGMDPLVTGRGKRLTEVEGEAFSTGRLVVLGLTAASRGNATGVGHADVTTERLCRSMDRAETYRNVVTSGALHRARTPVVAESDREAIGMALESLGGVTPEEVRVVRIKNTGEIGEFQVSTSLARELERVAGVEVGREEVEMTFDRDGNIL